MKKWYEASGREADVLVSTRIRLARNLQGTPFPGRMRSAQRRKVEAQICQAMGQDSLLPYGFSYISLEEAPKALAVSLVEHKLVSPEMIAERNGCGVMVTQDESVSVLINEEDHIRLQAMRPGLDLECAYRLLSELDRILNRSLSFAFDKDLGYLTQNPGDLGTGMHASLLLHLPALRSNGSVARMGAILSRLGLRLRGGWDAQTAADMFLLSNCVTLGLSEQTALENLKSIGMQLVEQERAERQKMARSLEMQDRVCRSLAILQSARLLGNGEFMELLSNVRMGVAVGLLQGLAFETLTTLLFRCQPAAMMLESGEPSSQLDILRARIVRTQLLQKKEET